MFEPATIRFGTFLQKCDAHYTTEAGAVLQKKITCYIHITIDDCKWKDPSIDIHRRNKPSGKRLHTYGTYWNITMSNGKTHSFAWGSIDMLNSPEDPRDPSHLCRFQGSRQAPK